MRGLEIASTAGAYYGFAYWCSCAFYGLLHKKRFGRAATAGIQAAFLVILVLYMDLNDHAPVHFFLPNMAIVLALMYALLLITLSFSPVKAGYYLARVFILGEFIASFHWQVSYYLKNRFSVTASPPMTLVILCASYGLLFALMYVLEHKYREEGENLVITRNELIYTTLITVVIYALSNLSFVTPDTPFTGNTSSEIFNIRTLVDFGGLAMLTAYHIQIAEHQMKFEVSQLSQLLKKQSEHFEVYENSIKLVNRKYHDLKHQIALMRSSLSDRRKDELLDLLEADILTYEAQNKSGNKILDIVLSAFSLKCQKDAIKFSCVAQGELLDFMDPLDISTLFGNVLDNAHEGSMKLDDPEKRLIHLTVSKSRSFIRIHCENYFTGTVQYREGLPVSTKGDDRFHGYGLKSVRHIVGKYRGSTTFSAENSWFEIRILLPFDPSVKE